MKCYFFGTFNPPHIGHLNIANKVKDLLGFEAVVFVPAFSPCHKDDCLVEAEHRLNMLDLIKGENEVSDIEFGLSTPSYSCNTINKLYNGEKISFIIGYDAFLQINHWKEPEVLKEKVHFVVIPRRKSENDETLGATKQSILNLKKEGWSFEILDGVEFMDVTSTDIRKCVKDGSPIKGCIAKEVEEYIYANSLYI